MLSIGEFSMICKVSTKTLRYYAEIGLIFPSEINPENGYRYYSVEQLETMLFINRLKSYDFSLEDIKTILEVKEFQEEILYSGLLIKRKKIDKKIKKFEKTIKQIEKDMNLLKSGKSIMSYFDDIDIQYVEVPMKHILSIRKMVHQNEFKDEYINSFKKLFNRIQRNNLTVASPPMVLFHDEEFSSFGLDTEFEIPVKEFTTGTRDFNAGLCLKTVIKGEYTELTSVYTKQIKWAQKEGYECSSALFEVYITDPTKVTNRDDLITEIYYPIRKKKGKL